MAKMTEEQQKLVEDNINLARYMALKWVKSGVRNFEYDEIFSMFSYALCKAAKSYDPSRGANFATYSARCMDNEIKMGFRKKGRIGGEDSQVNFEDPIHMDNDGNPLTLNDVFANNDHMEYDKVIDTMYAKEAFKTLRPREVLIMKKKFFENTTQRETAESMNISQSYISRLEKRILRKLHDWDKDLYKAQEVS